METAVETLLQAPERGFHIDRESERLKVGVSMLFPSNDCFAHCNMVLFDENVAPYCNKCPRGEDKEEQCCKDQLESSYMKREMIGSLVGHGQA
jgi:hypothetical protein